MPTDLEPHLHYWQKVLRLQDWLASVQWADWHDFETRSQRGDISFHRPTKRARIRILKEDQYCHGFGHAFDAEETLVHELCHLLIDNDGSDDATREREEIAVNCVSEALVALNRNQRP